MFTPESQSSLLTVLSILVAIAAFMLGDSASIRVRMVLGAIFLILVGLLIQSGVTPSSSLTTIPPISAPTGFASPTVESPTVESPTIESPTVEPLAVEPLAVEPLAVEPPSVAAATAVPPTVLPTVLPTALPTSMASMPTPPRDQVLPTPELPSRETAATLLPATAPGTVREFGGILFVFVPGGSFVMGSTESQVDFAHDLCLRYYGSECARTLFSDEYPPHTVSVNGFWIAQTEITNAVWRRFVDSGGYRSPSYWSNQGWEWRLATGTIEAGCWNMPELSLQQQPVVCVSWFEAEAFANWLSTETGLDVRLPSEAQWERAARGNDDRIFVWGNNWLAANVNYCDSSCPYSWADAGWNDGFANAAPVGSIAGDRSPYGVMDMAGNVWEWTSDYYTSDYAGVSQTLEAGEPAEDAHRTLRGGSAASAPSGVRTTARSGNVPGFTGGGAGLRVVIVLE